MKISPNQGTEFETQFDLEELGEWSWSLRAPEGVEADEVDWPTAEQCSAAAGVALDFFDAGDDPTRAEAILRVVEGVELNGEKVDYDAAVALMDEDLREQLHLDLAPCTDQEFLDEYAEAHKAKYKEEFRVQ